MVIGGTKGYLKKGGKIRQAIKFKQMIKAVSHTKGISKAAKSPTGTLATKTIRIFDK